MFLLYLIYCHRLVNFGLYLFIGDRSLVQGLVFDAKATEWFQQNFSTFNNKEDKGYVFSKPRLFRI